MEEFDSEVAALLPVVAAEEGTTGGELATTDTGADEAIIGDVDALLAAEGTAVSVVGPASVDVQDDKKTALTDTATNRPIRRWFIVRPPNVVQVTIPGETGVDLWSSTGTSRSGDKGPTTHRDYGSVQWTRHSEPASWSGTPVTSSSNGVQLTGNTPRPTALSVVRRSSGGFIIEGVQQ